MSFWKHANPAGAITDFVSVYRAAGKNRYRIAALSAALTFAIFAVMWSQSWLKERELPKITYINSWPVDRTEAETRKFIAESQVMKEQREKEEAAAAKESQDMWMAVGRASGFDVDRMKQQADAEKAAEKARQDAALKAKVGN